MRTIGEDVMQTLSYSLPQKPKVSLPMVAAVGALHLGFIYALLVGIDVIPPLPFVTKTTVDIVPKTPTTKPKVEEINPAITKRISVPMDPVPVFKIEDTTGGHGIPTKPGDGQTATMPTPPTNVSTTVGTHTIPAYPSLDRLLGHQGTVQLEMNIDDQGNVTDASVVQSSGYDGLDQAAIAWVKAHWRYHPATRDGKAVSSSTQAQVTFRLTQG
jgi:protein TonB